MALTKGFARNSAKTPLDQRLADMATIVANIDGSPRTGVINSGQSISIVRTLGSMNVAVDAAEFVTSKGKADGVMIFTNDGTVNVPIPAAPTANSRIDIVCVRHNDSTTGDANSNPVFVVRSGAAASNPAPPSLQTGDLELARLQIFAGTTATNASQNALTNTYQMTASRGGVVFARNKLELDAWTTAVMGQPAYIVNFGKEYRMAVGGWTGDVHFSYLRSAGFVWPTAETDFAWDNSVNDGILTGFASTDRIRFTCNEPGFYRVAGQVTADFGNSPLYVAFQKNAVSTRFVNDRASGDSYTSVRFDFSTRFEVGDTFKLRIQAPSAQINGVTGISTFMSVDSTGR